MDRKDPAANVEYWAIERLVPYAKNSRTHSDAQVAQIAASIKEWGFTNPVLVDEHGGIIAGHGRVQAARKLCLETIPVVVARGWSEAQKRAYVIADNKLALNAGWDDALLSLELGELGGIGFDLELTGFSEGELEELLGSFEAEELDEGLPKEFTGGSEDHWQLLVEYPNEVALAKAFDDAKKKGLTCKIIM